jgi:ABC-type glycerol-3-phosphate transport system permease component
MNYQLRDRMGKMFNHSLGYTILLLTTALLLIPVIWLLLSSLKQDSDYMAWPINYLPVKWMWSNYRLIFTESSFVKVSIRTFMLGITVATITATTSSMAGYAFARYQVPGNKKLFILVIAMLIVPGIVLLIPQFILFARLRLTNTYWPWILTALGGAPFFIFLYRQFFLNFPRELEEAAEIDGCGHSASSGKFLCPTRSQPSPP